MARATSIMTQRLEWVYDPRFMEYASSDGHRVSREKILGIQEDHPNYSLEQALRTAINQEKGLLYLIGTRSPGRKVLATLHTNGQQKPNNCPQCGAPNRKHICEYCGS